MKWFLLLTTSPDICQFWNTTPLFQPVKVHQQVHLRQSSQNLAKWANIGQHFACSTLKSTPTWKKSTAPPVLLAALTDISYAQTKPTLNQRYFLEARLVFWCIASLSTLRNLFLTHSISMTIDKPNSFDKYLWWWNLKNVLIWHVSGLHSFRQ